MQQPPLLTPTPKPVTATGEEALARIDQALAGATPIERPTPVSLPRTTTLADLFTVRILAAAIASPTSVALTVSVEGRFSPPGSRVTVGPTVVVWTVPATVVPAGE